MESDSLYRSDSIGRNLQPILRRVPGGGTFYMPEGGTHSRSMLTPPSREELISETLLSKGDAGRLLSYTRLYEMKPNPPHFTVEPGRMLDMRG